MTNLPEGRLTLAELRKRDIREAIRKLRNTGGYITREEMNSVVADLLDDVYGVWDEVPLTSENPDA